MEKKLTLIGYIIKLSKEVMKEKLEKWKKEIDEISNCVWKVSLTHELGPKVEKIGENLKQIEKSILVFDDKK